MDLTESVYNDNAALMLFSNIMFSCDIEFVSLNRADDSYLGLASEI